MSVALSTIFTPDSPINRSWKSLMVSFANIHNIKVNELSSVPIYNEFIQIVGQLWKRASSNIFDNDLLNSFQTITQELKSMLWILGCDTLNFDTFISDIFKIDLVDVKPYIESYTGEVPYTGKRQDLRKHETYLGIAKNIKARYTTGSLKSRKFVVLYGKHQGKIYRISSFSGTVFYGTNFFGKIGFGTDRLIAII